MISSGVALPLRAEEVLLLEVAQHAIDGLNHRRSARLGQLREPAERFRHRVGAHHVAVAQLFQVPRNGLVQLFCDDVAIIPPVSGG